MKFRKINSIFILTVLSLLLFSGCASTALPYTLPEERDAAISRDELEALRESYPINDDLSQMAFFTFDHTQTWEQYRTYNEIEAVVVLEITDELFYVDKGMNPYDTYDTDEQNEGVPTVTLTGVFAPAKILQVLIGDEALKNSEINLGFGSVGVVDPSQVSAVYQKGRVLVCLLRQSAAAYDVENKYALNKQSTFYLTETGVVLPVTDFIACFNDCAGMYLDTFTATVQENFFQPDAELTPVVPEQKTE